MDKVPLTNSNVPTEFHLNNQKMFGEKCKNVILDPKNGRHLLRSRAFEVKFMDKVSLIPSNVPTKFRLNKQNRFGEKCKTVISDP